MRRATTLIATLMTVLGLFAGPAMAQPPADKGPQAGPPRHPHALILGVEWGPEGPVGVRKCVDVAGNNRLPHVAHHGHLHTGRAGEAQFNSGNLVTPRIRCGCWRTGAPGRETAPS